MTHTTAGTGALTFEAISAAELAEIRAAGRDEAGNSLTVRADNGGSPVRCCLRETRPGERVMLIAYTPPGTAGAYAERGPVFVHADPCEGYPGLRHRMQVVRAYDRQGRIADGVLAADGLQAEAVIAEMVARPDVELVHLRNVGYGCYNFAVRGG
jgi:hypothetical protein